MLLILSLAGEKRRRGLTELLLAGGGGVRGACRARRATISTYVPILPRASRGRTSETGLPSSVLPNCRPGSASRWYSRSALGDHHNEHQHGNPGRIPWVARAEPIAVVSSRRRLPPPPPPAASASIFPMKVSIDGASNSG